MEDSEDTSHILALGRFSFLNERPHISLCFAAVLPLPTVSITLAITLSSDWSVSFVSLPRLFHLSLSRSPAQRIIHVHQSPLFCEKKKLSIFTKTSKRPPCLSSTHTTHLATGTLVSTDSSGDVAERGTCGSRAGACGFPHSSTPPSSPPRPPTPVHIRPHPSTPIHAPLEPPKTTRTPRAPRAELAGSLQSLHASTRAHTMGAQT